MFSAAFLLIKKTGQNMHIIDEKTGQNMHIIDEKTGQNIKNKL